MADDQPDRHPDSAVAVVRRAPFSDNPKVGARGQRTQQRILDAALRAFGETGFHGCNVNRIAKLARCSRVSFYQYFASKEDVFAHLAGQVARQLSASTETLDQLTPDRAGWTAMRAWIERYAEIYARYEPVFNALETDDALAATAQRTGEETVARVHSRMATTTLPPRQLDPVIRVLLETVNHTFEVTGVLRSVEPDAYPSARIEVALTDVLHRTFFGTRAEVNVHPLSGDSAPTIEFDRGMLDLLQQGDEDGDSSGNRALLAVLASGRDVFVSRGYHNTRVDDLAAAAGVSHGAIYRYFKNKAQLARMLNARAIQSVGATVLEIPDVATLDGPAGKAALRKWLRKYHAAQANEAAMLRVWVDAALQDPALRAESAPPLDWGRRRMARYLKRRDFGDYDTEAIVMVALFGVFGARPRPAADIEAVAHIIERGLLGQ
jgi:AcrR family transcriptional regulator